MRRLSIAPLLCAAVIAGCGATADRPEPPRTEAAPVKMRHQIMFTHQGQTHVFEGYMLLHGSALLVKAFAGPGVDLFTVVRNGPQHREELHMRGLEEKMDLVVIGRDIARVYLGGCDRPKAQGQVTCDLYGDQMVEVFSDDNTLSLRRFPDAYQVGLQIRYAEYAERSGRQVPTRISLIWGNGQTRMEIRLLSFEILDHIDEKLFEIQP